MVSSFEHGNLYGVKESGGVAKGGSQDASLEQIRTALHYKQYGRISNRPNGAFNRTEEAARLKALGYGVIRSPLLLGILREIRKKETLFPGKPIVGVTCI